MRTVVAALDASPAARPVLETAIGLAQLTGAVVEAVHVPGGPAKTPELLASRSGVPLRLLDGPVEAALLEAMAAPDVIAAVLGARSTRGGRRPIGHVALRVLKAASKPVVVVPPEAVTVSPRPLRRILVPLEGTEATSRSVVERLCPLIVDDVELLVLHVFTPATMPRVLDHPGRDLQLLGDEFLAHHCPDATTIELRTGQVGNQVEAASADAHADLIVLSWSQDSSPGHAGVILDVLAHADVPVLLLPVDPTRVIDIDAEASDRELRPVAR